MTRAGIASQLPSPIDIEPSKITAGMSSLSSLATMICASDALNRPSSTRLNRTILRAVQALADAVPPTVNPSISNVG